MPATAGIPACAADPELMFPPKESTRAGKPNAAEQRAIEVCRRCPVLDACRAAVLDPADPMPTTSGVVGGLTEADRRAVRAEQSLALPEQAAGSEGVGERAAVPAPRVALDEQAVPASWPAIAGPGRAARPTPPPSTSAPSVIPTALAMLDRATDSGSSRSPGRSSRRERAVVPAPASTPAVVKLGDELDELIAKLLRSYPASLGDAATVRELVLERGPATASRWEVAVAAMVLLARDTPAETTARLLGEDGKQVRRWRERRDAGRPLVLGGPGTGTHRLVRPDRLVAATTDSTTHSDGATAAVTTYSARAVDTERGAA